MTTCAQPRCLGDDLGASPALARVTAAHVGVAHVFDARFRPSTRLTRHDHAHARFSFILSGSIGEIADDRSVRCERNTLSFHPATLPHGNEIWIEGAHALLIEICGNDASDLAMLTRACTVPFAMTQRHFRDVSIALSRALHGCEPVQTIVAEALTLDFLARAMPRVEERSSCRLFRRPAWLDDLDTFIDDRLEGPLSVNTVAARMRVTPRQFATALQRHLGTTFVALLRRRRVERAKVLLSQSDAPVAAVALACGFADQSHLGRCFRVVAGTTPSRFRRESRTRLANTF